MWKALVFFAFVATVTTVAGDEPQSVDDSVVTDVTVTPDTGTNEETNDGCEPQSEDDSVATDVTVTADTGTNEETNDGCGYPPICGKDEVFNNCTYTGCTVTRCSQLGYPLKCDKCTPGCICKDGYVRADNDTCIPKINCPSCGGDKNAVQGCSNYCGQTCSTYNKPRTACPLFCIFNGCACKSGFVYDNNVRACVKPGDCTPTCNANEQYSSCTNGGCDARNCSQLGRPVPCVKLDPKACIKGCVCVDGYLRASNGTCVPKDQCGSKLCGNNEHYEECSGDCSNQSCGDVGRSQRSCPGQTCRNGCRCNKGYCRDSNNACILIPSCSGINEAYNFCINPECKPNRCSEVGFPLKCGNCKPGCACKSDFYRADNGTCVTECPACGGDVNAYMGCSGNYSRTCANYTKTPAQRTENCKPNSCSCRSGYVYDDNIKACVKIENCTPVCKGNEQYSPCTNGGCDARNCSQLGKPVPCVKLDPKACIKGCVCVDGYLRASNGTCVPKDQCESKLCRNNEHYEECSGDCSNQSCGDVGRSQRSCPGQTCRNGCRCNKGYCRDLNNACILIPSCSGINEAYNFCINPECKPNRCSEVGFPFKCGKCKPGCDCKSDFYRADNGNCVTECPACGGDVNAYMGCSGNYSRTCANYTKTPAQRTENCKTNSCSCRSGYVYDDNIKACVKIENCTPVCKENEQYSPCTNGGCDARNCSQLGKPVPCVKLDPKACIKGCVCVDGYLRASNGTCVPKDQCTPTPSCPDGQEYSQCPTVKCEGDYCPKTRDSPQTCPVGIVCNKPRCVCGLNKKIDWKTGKCIPITDCPKFKCRINEEYQACPRPCSGDNCADYFHKRKCPIGKLGIPLICRPQCKCVRGFYRNTDGTCVPACDCPKQTTSIETTTTPVTPVVNTTSDRGTQLTGLLDGITAFTGKCLYNRMKSSPLENIAMSASSVMIPIGILCLYSEDVAYDQCIKILNLQDKADIRNTFPSLASSYNGQTTVNFTTAAKIYSNVNYELSNDIKEDSVNVFRAGAQELDFSNPELAAQIINAWVESETNSHIKDLVTKDMFSALTRLVLVNAIYYKGDWLYQFDEENTKDEDFYLSDGTTKTTKLMSQLGNFNYVDVPELNCTALEMKYKGENFSMVIVLPNAVDGALTMAEKLQNPDNWNKIYGSLANEKVQMYIPSFEINTSTDLKDLLKKVNITKWFEPDDSGISRILKEPEAVYISEAIQKAYIKCDAKGSEATAANAFVGATTTAIGPPPRPPKMFKADHGFLFYILLKGTAIFSGYCGNP